MQPNRARKTINANIRNQIFLPLLQSTSSNTLLLVHFRGVTSRLERVAGGRQGFQILAVVLVGL